MLLHHADIYSVMVVVVGVDSLSISLYTKTGDYIGDLYWSPIGY